MLLPAPPSLDQIARNIPAVNTISSDTRRPFWSVMIPTYNCGNYLRRTLESVLCQDPGPEKMQLEVVDGCSTHDDPETVINEVAKGRVSFHRIPRNEGAANTFNACIHRSVGHWVHIIHGDDQVRPGFYDAYESAIYAFPTSVMVLGGYSVIDEYNNFIRDRPRDDVDGVGIIPDFASRQAFKQLASFPAVVVRRSSYEAAGGFCTWFSHVVDMDMWLRIGLLGDVAGVHETYALYREHRQSLSSQAIMNGESIRERVLLTLINRERLRRSDWRCDSRAWKSEVAEFAHNCAWDADRAASTFGRLVQASWAFRVNPSMESLWFLAKSWLKHRIRPTDH